MPQLFNRIVGDTPEQQAVIDEIMRRGEEERRQIARENALANARIAGGALLSGASALPIFNIPYIGTGIGGAMEGAGNAIMQGKSGKDIAKDAGIGFAIGETVGAIPYAGKFAGKTKAGQAVANKASGMYNKLMATDAAVNVAKALDTDVKDFATPLYRRIKEAKAYGTSPFVKSGKARADDTPENNILDLTGIFESKVSPAEVKSFIQSLVQEGAIPTKSPDYLIDVPNAKRNQKHIQYQDKWEKLPRKIKERHNSLALKLKEIIKNSEHTGNPKPPKDPKTKKAVEKYHYFTVDTKIGDEIIPIVLDTEQFIGESTVKPQTVHLYNFKEKK